MTNLRYSLDLIKEYNSHDANVDRTIKFFGTTAKERSAFAEIIDAVQQVEAFMDRLNNTDTGLHLSDGDEMVNYSVLTEAIETAQLSTIYVNIRMIRQELVVVATKKNLDEMKELYDFWEFLELPIQQMLK